MKEITAQRRLSQMVKMTAPCRAINMRQTLAMMTQRESFFTDAAKPENSEDVPYPLTKEEALLFVKTKLQIPDPEAMIAKDRVEFLHRVAEQLKKNIPFTNIHYFTSTPAWEMDEHDLKRHMLSGEGGTCSRVNSFTKALLEQFGYRAHNICGYNPGDLVQDGHLSTIVEDAAYPGSLHLVDPGTRRPLCAAIPIDFETESPEYKFHFLRSKFFRDGDQLIWCSKAPTKKPGEEYTICDSDGNMWKQEVLYHLNEKRNWFPYWEHMKAFFRIAGNNLAPPFNGLVFFAYLNGEQIVSVLAFQDSTVAHLYHPDGTYQQMTMTKPALMQLFRENFPQYSETTLKEVFERRPFN